MMRSRVCELVVSLAESACFDNRTVCDSAEREHDGSIGQRFEFVGEKAIACIDFYERYCIAYMVYSMSDKNST